MSKKNTKIIISCVVAALLVVGAAIGVHFAINTAYSNGVADGEAKTLESLADKVKDLGKVVSDKTNFIKELQSTLTEIPAELNSENIDGFIEKIQQLFNKTDDTNVQNFIKEYLGKWSDFKETYASEDNTAISEAFNALKSATDDIASKLKEYYDTEIKTALEKI